MTLALPTLKWTPSPNFSSRGGTKVDLICVHDCEGSYAGAVAWFAQARSQVSSHFVLREDGLEATQMVRLSSKAWHACDFNGRSVGLEMGGFSKKGFDAPEWDNAAAIVAYLLHSYDLPCRWAEHGSGPGFCSHYDLGKAGGGHYDPTTDSQVWAGFVIRVQRQFAEPVTTWPVDDRVPAPTPPATYTPTSEPRHGFAEGSVEWVQAALNAHGAKLVVDGLEGIATITAIRKFQAAHGLTPDGVAGPLTIAALNNRG